MRADFGQTDRGYPIDYPVPSFGSDPEIDDVRNSIKITEKKFKRKMKFKTNQ